MLWAIILLAGGLAALWKCAGFLVSGAIGLAERLGISALVIGLTVVAMGTSAPEVAASIAAALRNSGDVAVGNVYGSNIANLALVGGLCVLIRPMRVPLRVLRREIPVMLMVGLLLWPVLNDMSLSRLDGISLLAVFAALILWTVRMALKEKPNNLGTQEHQSLSIQKSLLFVVIGLAGLALGADMTVRAAVFIGERIGLSKAVIGLTIVAIGTSLPELATCTVASLKGHHDISVGNLVGSNIFNTLLVTGAAGTIRPFALAQRLAGIDYWIMIIVTGCFILMASRRTIGRFSGVVLLCEYVAYMVYLFGYTTGV
ncbi:MAG: calcium/sodium antiporter [Planctomycetes bacterium]|nr:calcium/sodium antiporter [Planctomycetota bacterium]